MPRKEFISLVEEIKTSGEPKKMSIRSFLWLFDFCEKRTSGNLWRINEFLNNEKLIVTPNLQHGVVDDIITLREKDKAKIKKDGDNNIFDPISRVSNLDAIKKTPLSVRRDAKIEKAYHIMWHNNFSQVPVMNDERTVLGIVNWQTIAKGFIAKKDYDTVKDFMSQDFAVVEEVAPIFDAIKKVIKYGVVFIKDAEKKIRGPITTSDLSEEFLEQIEPFILLEQIENYIRLILNNKIVLEDIHKCLTITDDRVIEVISDMTFGEYIRVMENEEFWPLLQLPFDKTDFVLNIEKIRIIRNSVMHFHPDKISESDLKLLRNTSKFLQDYFNT